MNAVVILNQDAGSLKGEPADLAPDNLRRVFAVEGVSAQVRRLRPAEMEAAFTEILADPPAAVFVGGGDGTISTAAGYLAGRAVPLGVLPLGTLNHFAHDLGVPLDWREAVAALAHGDRRRVDLGEVNGRTFINNCSIGSYADAVRKRDALRRLHGIGKWWAMLRATIAVFRRLRRLRVRIESEGQQRALRTPFLVVANNRYSGRVLNYSLRPQLDEGRLWIYTTKARRRLAIVRLIAQSIVRDLDGADDLDRLAVTEAMLSTERAAPAVAIDGELAKLDWPLHFRTRPAALHVLAPRTEKVTG